VVLLCETAVVGVFWGVPAWLLGLAVLEGHAQTVGVGVALGVVVAVLVMVVVAVVVVVGVVVVVVEEEEGAETLLVNEPEAERLMLWVFDGEAPTVKEGVEEAEGLALIV